MHGCTQGFEHVYNSIQLKESEQQSQVYNLTQIKEYKQEQISQDSNKLETKITNTNNYDITINDLGTRIICLLYFNNTNYESTIEQTDLKSGIISLLKLKNILKLNSSKTQPNFLINFELIKINTTNLNHLIMQIIYSDNFIDFEEKLYFKKKMTENDIQENLREIVQSQSEQIQSQSEQIQSQLERIQSQSEQIQLQTKQIQLQTELIQLHEFNYTNSITNRTNSITNRTNSITNRTNSITNRTNSITN